MFRSIIAAALAAGALLSVGAARAEAVTPLAVYGGLPSAERVEISPDGTLLAVSATDGEQRMLLIRENKEGGALIRAMRFGESKFRDVQWAGADHVIITVSHTTSVFGLEGPKREWLMGIDLNIRTGKQVLLLKDQADSMNVILDRPMIRIIGGDPFAFVEGFHFRDNRGWATLFRINLRTGQTKMLDQGGDETTDEWLVAPDGEPLAQSLYNQQSGAWSLKMRDQVWKVAARETRPFGSHGLAGLGRDGRSALVWTFADDDSPDSAPTLSEYAPDGTRTPVPGGAALDDLIHAPSDGALLGGFALVGDELRYTFFDTRTQAIWKSVIGAFPGDRVTLASWSNDRRKVVAMVDSATQGPAYAVVDLDTKTARWLTNVYRDLPETGVSEVRPVRYKAADGLEISGYLTLPRGRAPRDLPLVVLPHGGPAARDEPGFDWWSQGLASRGYAVLRPNFRGSSGYGSSFLRKGFGEWGKAMQTDLSDGVRHLAKQGLIDPKKVCIVGASYGGYAALAGATIDRGVYRCAVSVAGPSDLRRMLKSTNRLHRSGKNAATRYWLNFMGADGIRDPDLEALSPALLADRADIPVLLIHGKDDTVVPYEQSMVMASALKKAGKPYELVTLAGEDHWLSRGATRQQMLNATVAFLERQNPPR